ncbi:MAG: tRNA (adenosine(37)-N6)-threonylcarbamoyltransferase complex transferase subunit TsaD [Planctomycetota bacterium]|nr:tRNA (adenosine(37)-N6)-threonylcarbamoyltransferase complex transferase subunit TsaD [Planctomycetota bacterium]
MNQGTRILGIETSCDETSAAVVEDGRRILSNVVASQFDLHRPFGGVVPEVAARAHAERITAVIDEALALAKCTPRDISAICVANRPGLVGALLVGIAAAKALCIAWDKPLLGMDHIHGHVYAARLAGFSACPHIALIVSGGHTCLYRVTGPLEMSVLGQTADDAAGEAFDKVAKMLNLGFPGGPALAKAAEGVPLEKRGLFRDVVKTMQEADTVKGREAETQESRGANPLDFSFSGLKTAVYYHLRGTTKGRGPLREISPEERAQVAASFQETACDIMASKSIAACRREEIRALAIGGGVACNRRLRELLKERASAANPPLELFFPPPILCADNAAMIAGLAYHRLLRGEHDDWDMEADPTPRRA